MKVRSIHDDSNRKGVFIRLWVLDMLQCDYATSLLLCQLLYWHQPEENGRRRLDFERDGHLWLLRSDEEWEDARLSVRQVRRARTELLRLGLIEHRKFRRDGAPTSAWRPLYDAIQAAQERQVSTDAQTSLQSDALGEVSTDASAQLSTDVPTSLSTDAQTSLQSDAQTSLPIPSQELEVQEKENHSVAEGDREVVVPDDQRVFDAWREAVGKPRAIFDPERRSLVGRRLRDYPAEVLIDAVRGWKHDPFYCGHNDRGIAYNDFGFLLKTAARVEKFSGYERGIGRPRPVTANGAAHKPIDTDRTGPSGRLKV